VKAAASGVSTGVGFTPYANAYLILILPHSIIAVSVVTALLPKISNLVIDKKYDAVSVSLAHAIKLIGVFTVPAALLFLSFGPLMATNLFFGISAEDSNYLGLTLSAFALGLIPLSINLVLLRGLNAFENLKSQVLGNLIMNAVAVALSLFAAHYLKPEWVTVAMAGIFALTYFLGTGISFYLISRHKINLPVSAITTFYLKLMLIFTIITLPIWLLREHLPGGNLLQLLVVIFLPALFYLLIAKVLKITEVTSLIKVITARRD
ncbi:MAG: hypothetical protein RL356_308, partial [Actinomycetota bacterium]